MRTRIALHWGIVAAFSMLAFTSMTLAQTSTTAPSASPADDRLNRLEQRFDDLEKKYEADTRSRDEEIARLRNQLTAQRATSTAPDEIEKTKQDVLSDIESRNPVVPTLRTPASFNPDLAVITDFKGNVSTDNANPARNRFDVGTVEFELRAPVDPRADAVAVIPFTRDVDDPLFFNTPAAPGAGDVNTGSEIEEAYLYLHDFGVENLTAKLGRFHLHFGRWNLLHDHDWPTVDNNFAAQSFLANESITDSGLSLSYVIPPKLIGNQYVELDAEIISGEGDSDEQPVINNDALVDSPALNTHILWNHDLAKDLNLEIGGSWLTGKHDNAGDQNANLFGADFTLVHTDPKGGFFNQLLQAEAIYGITDTTPDTTQHAFGCWLLAQQQLDRDWYVGCRLDWTQNALDEHQETWGISPYLTWYWSEFLRFRAEYQHKAGDVKTEDTLYFQAVWIFGAHPPHPYWSMK